MNNDNFLYPPFLKVWQNCNLQSSWLDFPSLWTKLQLHDKYFSVLITTLKLLDEKKSLVKPMAKGNQSNELYFNIFDLIKLTISLIESFNCLSYSFEVSVKIYEILSNIEILFLQQSEKDTNIGNRTRKH